MIENLWSLGFVRLEGCIAQKCWRKHFAFKWWASSAAFWSWLVGFIIVTATTSFIPDFVSHIIYSPLSHCWGLTWLPWFTHPSPSVGRTRCGTWDGAASWSSVWQAKEANDSSSGGVSSPCTGMCCVLCCSCWRAVLAAAAGRLLH